MPELAEELGISANLLYNWRLSSQRPQFRSEGPRAVGEQDAADELRALRRELTRPREENDILKKAAVILGTKPQPNSEPGLGTTDPRNIRISRIEDADVVD